MSDRRTTAGSGPRDGSSVRAFVLGLLLSGLFAWITIMRDNFPPVIYLSANLIPVLPHVLLVLAGIVVNPLLDRVRFIRSFSKTEMLVIFVMCAVSSGVATFGLSGPLVPIVSALSNPAWNTDQSQWDIGAMPFLNENYFIAEKGVRAKALELRKAHLTFEAARIRYRVARDLTTGIEELERVESDLEEASAITDPEQREARLNALKWPLSQAKKLVEAMETEWERIGGDLDIETVANTYGEKVAELKSQRDALRKELRELNKPAADAVAEVRKGLAPGKRALPGFFYDPGEGLASYSARFQRLKVGGASLEKLREVERALASAIEQGKPLPEGWRASVQSAADMLDEISEIPVLSAEEARLTEQLAALDEEIATRQEEARHLRHLRRYSNQNQFAEFNDRIEEAEENIEQLKEQAEGPRERVEKQVRPLLAVCERVKETQGELRKIAVEAGDAGRDDYAALHERLQAAMAAYPGFDATPGRYWLGDVRWGLWLRPIFNWLVIILVAYVVLMAFNVLIYRQWAHNEKLIYPLAEVAVLLAGGGRDEGKEKPLFRSALFWTGFTISAGILGWNYLASNHIVSNIKPIPLQFLWLNYVRDSVFSGLASTYFCIIFAVIGISFLVPSSISFSLWFFELCYMGLLLVMVWMGYGENRWSLGNVGRSGIGAGAMLVFGITILYSCRQYLLCAFRPSVLNGLKADERKELRISSWLFLGGSVVLILLLSFGLGANLFYVIVYFLIVMTMIIAIVRAVAEGGVLGLESFASAFSIMKVVFGMTKAWCAPVLIAPLVACNSLLFGGFKAMIAPMMGNALKVRESMRVRRLHFHGAIWAGIIAAVVVSVVTLIIISYQHGADNLGAWMNDLSAKGTIAGVRGLAENTGPVKPSDRSWMIAGAVLMAGLLFSRRRIFGVPHPIGLLMIMNPVMFGLWGSILIGWGFKSVVSKYCSNEQYVVIRRFFLGLVLGHLVAVFFGWEQLKFHWG